MGSAPLVVRSLFSFGGSIVNNLLSLGAEPTNVVRQDGRIKRSDIRFIETVVFILITGN